VLAGVGGEVHGGGVVVGVDDGNAGVPPAELGQLRPERAVVELGEVVGPPEAAHGVVLRRVVGLELGQVPGVAPDREVPGHNHCPGA
jgi:hypothetical protein